MPSTDEQLTMRPAPFLRIAGMSRRVRSCVPTRLTSSCSRSSAGVRSSTAPGWPNAALLNKAVEPAARQFESPDRARRDRLRIGEFETQRFNALELLEPGEIIGAYAPSR